MKINKKIYLFSLAVLMVFIISPFSAVRAQEAMGDYHCCTPCQNQEHIGKSVADGNCQAACNQNASIGLCPATATTTPAGGKTAEQLQAAAASELNKLGGIKGDTAGAAALIGRAIQLLMAFMGSIALVLYIYAGIVWMTASGAKDKVAQAQKVLVWTTFGVVVMLGSYILTSFLFKMF
jgi:hypothetical protein